MIDLEDPRTAKIADVISNKTSKRILGLLAENELSESELAKSLDLPLNTIEYNIKKLEEAGLIEKIKGFLWSVKGKRIHRYKISNKKIIISPRNMMKGIIPTVLISGIAAFGIKLWIDRQVRIDNSEGSAQLAKIALEKSSAALADSAEAIAGESISRSAIAIAQNVWLWFFAGALAGLLIYLLWNLWRK